MTTQDHSGTHATLADSGDTTNSQELPRGSNLGRYVIIEPIGSGGMGTVYRAYDPQLNRGVALKILSVKQEDIQAAERAKARLIREAQALAQLSHPNVVAVHDAGTVEDDVFIAMELVEGKTLDEWMKQEKRTVKDVLELMIAAGRGLSAAHKAGLIHRDFKPGNVIVGDDGRVRVLDFGLARAADQAEVNEEKQTELEAVDSLSQEPKDAFDLEEMSSDSSLNLLLSPLTHVGGVLGTPMYMAPEQHLGLKTDERTDQFGFCVVLYEALYEKRPFTAESMEELKSEVIRQQVCVPRADSDVPVWLWKIIYKGLSAKPEDRYATIDLLLEELEKDPEEVRRQKRLTRRRKLLVISMMALIVVVPIGVWYGLRYRTFQLCKAAEGEFAGVWDETTKVSIRKAFLTTGKSFAQGTWERVAKIFDSYQTDWVQMRSDVCEARLIRATQSEELFDLRMSCLQKRLGELKALVKVFARADNEVLQKSIQASSSLTSIAICADEGALRAPYPPPKTQDAKTKVADIREKLTEVEVYSKTGKYIQGLQLVRKLVGQAKKVDYRPVLAEALFWFSDLLSNNGEFKQAEINLHEAARTAGKSGDVLFAAKAMAWLVWVVGYQQARYKDGLLFSQAAQVMLDLVGRKNSALQARLYNNIGILLGHQGEHDKAIAYHCESLVIVEKTLGPNHPEMAYTLSNLGTVFEKQGEYKKAYDYFMKALVIWRTALGPEHPKLGLTLDNIGNVLSAQGECEQALGYLREGLSIKENALGPNHPAVGYSMNNLGALFEKQGDYNKAYVYFQKASEIWKEALGPEHPLVATSLNNLGDVLKYQGENKKALDCYHQSFAIREKALGPSHPGVVWPLSRIGIMYVDQGLCRKALQSLERVVILCEKKACNPNPHALALFGLAQALVKTGRDWERAIMLAKKARKIFSKAPKTYKKEIEQVNTWLKKHGASKLAKKAPK